MQGTTKKSWGYMAALLGAVMFSTKAIFVKLAFKETGTDAVTLLSLRMLCSLPVYLGALILPGKTNDAKPTSLSRTTIALVAAMGILGYYLSSLLDFIGLQYVPAGIERLILFLYPTFSVLINHFVFKQRIDKNQSVALVLTYLGIAIACGGEIGSQGPMFYFGASMVFLCSVTYSVYLVGTGKLVGKVGTQRYTALAMLFASAAVFGHYLFVGHLTTPEIHTELWKYSLLLAIVATVVPSFLISYGMNAIGSNNVSIITSIGPVSTILQAQLFLGEPIKSIQILGTVLVLIGVLALGRKATETANKAKG